MFLDEDHSQVLGITLNKTFLAQRNPYRRYIRRERDNVAPILEARDFCNLRKPIDTIVSLQNNREFFQAALCVSKADRYLIRIWSWRI